MSKLEFCIRIGLLVGGILIHAIFPFSFMAFCIGALMMIFCFVKLFNNYEERIYEDPGEKEVGKWVPFPEDKLEELLGYVEAKFSINKGGSKDLRGSVFGNVLAFGGCLILGACASVVLTDTLDYFVLFFDICFVCVVFYNMSGAGLPPHPLCIQKIALDVFRVSNLPAGFKKKFEARIVKDINGDPDILEARLQIRPEKEVKGMICMMVTINRTSVQGMIYPYAYGVIVFKGSGMATRSSATYNEISYALNGSGYKCDALVQNSDSVFVFLPISKSQYTTTETDCANLAQVMYNACNVIDNHRAEIETMTK